MTHRYLHPIDVRLAEEQPHTFRWRAREYRVVRVLATWHLRDRWWAAGSEAASERPSDRHYYRLDCAPDLICDVYYDAAVSVKVGGDAASGETVGSDTAVSDAAVSDTAGGEMVDGVLAAGAWILDRVYD